MDWWMQVIGLISITLSFYIELATSSPSAIQIPTTTTTPPPPPIIPNRREIRD